MEYMTASVKDLLRYNKHIFHGSSNVGTLGYGYLPSSSYKPLSLILHDIVSALSYIHGLLLTHRDIKVRNREISDIVHLLSRRKNFREWPNSCHKRSFFGWSKWFVPL